MKPAQSETPLATAAAAYLDDPSITPFTTPGHKRSEELADEFLVCDLPLSSGADDLHLTGDLLGQAEALAADLWGADLCRFCVNGSTQGNQALALAVGRPGEKVIVSRGLHKSLFAGLVLAGLVPVWIRPDVDPATGLALALPLARVRDALRAAPDARAIFLVEPNFVGVVSDVAAIAALAHDAGVPVVVDQAWGAHLGFHTRLPANTLSLGADAMVTSAHKTLSAFTQSAYLFAQSGRLDHGRLREGFDALNTTSVSAAILASLDRTRALMAARGDELLGRTIDIVDGAKERLAAVPGLRILGPGRGVPSYDRTKLVLAVSGTGADGLEVEADLVENGIRLELANRDTLIPLVTIGDTEASVSHLVDALERSFAQRSGELRLAGSATVVWGIEPEIALAPRDAFFAPRETVTAEHAAGRTSAETIAPYPPGIPAIAPGEVVSAELLAALREAAAHGTRIAYCADPTLRTIEVVAR